MQTNTLESERKLSEEYQTFVEEQTEIEACAKSCEYFLRKYGKIRHPLKGTIPFEAWPHLIQILKVCEEHRLIIILKAKQLGITWLMAGRNLWRAMFQSGANVFTLSKGEDEAAESLDYSKFIHDNLPPFLQLPYGKKQESVITFPTMNSKIKALPSTRDAGVGFGGATLAVLDEFEYHDYAKENYSEVKPMIDAGGQLIILSTADKLRVGTKFKELYNRARAGESNFYKIFLPYDLLTYRTAEWYGQLKLDYRDWEIECKFPRTEDEALSTLATRALWDETILAGIYQYLEPADVDMNTYGGIVSVYKPVVVGAKYCMFTDPSDGKTDPFHTVVMERQTGEGVCEAHGKVPADMCAQIHDGLARYYNNAYNSHELTGTSGGKFDETLKNLETPNRAFFVKTDGTLDYKKHGWWTGPQLKKKMVWGLEEAVRKREIITHSKDTITEFKGMIIPEGKEPQATPGMHDDRFMAWAGAWQIAKYIPMGKSKAFSAPYGQNRRLYG